MMIFVGLDDTDTLDSPGTNQLAKSIVAELADRFECVLILRHQLLDDPRVPYTSQNGSASILLKPLGEETDEDTLCDQVFQEFRAGLKQRFVPGSDPGLCVTAEVPRIVTEFGLHCQRKLTSQRLARRVARQQNIRLEGLGGTEDGVIGALAAVGLAATRNDGRVVKLGTWPDDLSGWHPVESVTARNVFVQDVETNRPVFTGMIDVGKHLRPNYRNGRVVLFAKAVDVASWEAVRLK